MNRSFQVEFAVYTWWADDFLVSWILKENPFSTTTEKALDWNPWSFPFSVKSVLDIPEWIWMDRIEEIMWNWLARWINNYMLSILNQIYCSNPELRKIFDSEEWTWTFRVINVKEITIH